MVGRTFTRRDACRVGALALGGLAGIGTDATVAGDDPGARGRGSTREEHARVTIIRPEDGQGEDQFGWSVAMDGTTAVVGARGRTHSNGSGAGAVAVFEKTERGWNSTALLALDDGDPQDRFGNAVDVDGTTIVAGERADEHPNGVNAGSAYVFERTDGEWRQASELSPEDVDRDDQFENAVSVSGDTVVVGAPQEDVSGQTGAGTVRVYRRQDDTWYKEERLFVENPVGETSFGRSVALDETTLLVGDPDANRVSVYDRKESVWSLTADFAPRVEDLESELFFFGTAVDVVDGTAIVATPGRDGEAVHRFVLDGSEWRREAVLQTFDSRSGADFGMAVSTTGSGSVVGALGDRRAGASRVGSAYVFDRGVSATTTERKGGSRSLSGFGVGAAALGLGGGFLWRRIHGSE